MSGDAPLRTISKLKKYVIPAGFDILLGGAEAAALQLQLKERIRSLQLHLDQYRQYEAILQSSKRLENYLFQEYCSEEKQVVRREHSEVLASMKDILKLGVVPLPMQKQDSLELVRVLETPYLLTQAAHDIAAEAETAEACAVRLAKEAAVDPNNQQLAGRAEEQQEKAAALRESSAFAEAAAADEVERLTAVDQDEMDRHAAFEAEYAKGVADRKECDEQKYAAYRAEKAAAGQTPRSKLSVLSGMRTPPRDKGPWIRKGLRFTVAADTSADQRHADRRCNRLHRRDDSPTNHCHSAPAAAGSSAPAAGAGASAPAAGADARKRGRDPSSGAGGSQGRRRVG